MIFVKELQKGETCLKREKLFLFIKIGEKAMHETRKAVVYKPYIKLAFLFFGGFSPLYLLHHVHERCHNLI